MECVQVKVTSNGSKALPAGVSIPGVYKATDPGILFDIYNSFTSYPIPGPAVWDGSSGSPGSSGSAPGASITSVNTKQAAAETAAPTTFATATKPTTTAAPAGGSSSSSGSGSSSGSSSTGSGSASGSIKIFQQCGGQNFSGAGSCESGLVCKQWNPYYHQCVAA